MNIDGNLVEVVLDELKDLLKLLSRGLSEQFLAEEVCNLVHH